MAEYTTVINEDAEGKFTARIYDGKMKIFMKQDIPTQNKAFAAVRKFLKEQQKKIESGELLILT